VNAELHKFLRCFVFWRGVPGWNPRRLIHGTGNLLSFSVAGQQAFIAPRRRFCSGLGRPDLSSAFFGLGYDDGALMKIRMCLALPLLVVAGGLSVCAADNPAQAAARLALEQKLQELESPPAQPPAAPQPKTAAPPEAVTPPSAAVTLLAVPAPAGLTATVPAIAAAPATAVPFAAPPPAAIEIAPAVAAVPASPPPIAAPPAPTPPPAAIVFDKPTDSIVTIYGTVYKNAQVERVVADGVLISYWTDDGGFAITKLDFKMLSPELQKQYRK
jgi:hypothetical protein